MSLVTVLSTLLDPLATPAFSVPECILSASMESATPTDFQEILAPPMFTVTPDIVTAESAEQDH